MKKSLIMKECLIKCAVAILAVVICIYVYQKHNVQEYSSETFQQGLHGITALTNTPSSSREEYTSENGQLHVVQNVKQNPIPVSNSSKNNESPSENVVECQSSREKRHVYYLKAHKTGSTTARNILQRFVMKRNLTTPVFFTQNCYPSHTMTRYLRGIPTYWQVFNQLRQSGQTLNTSLLHYLKNLPEEVRIRDNQCNVLAVHSVFVKEEALKIFPPNVTFISTLRHPLAQMISAFGQWGLPNRYKIPPNLDPVEEFLRDPEKYDVKLPASLYNPISTYENLTLSYTRNYIAYEFGFDLERAENDQDYVDQYLVELNNTFKVIIFTDLYTQSLVLLKRELNWSFQDILFIQLRRNTLSSRRREKQYKVPLLQNHRKWTFLDYALYDMFRKRHNNLVKQGGDLFQKELGAFESVLGQVTDFCMDEVAPRVSRTRGLSELKELARMKKTIAKTEFSCEFDVDASDCVLMSICEKIMWIAARVQKYPQLCEPDFRNFVSKLKVQGTVTPFCNQPDDNMRYNIPYKMMKGAFWKT